MAYFEIPLVTLLESIFLPYSFSFLIPRRLHQSPSTEVTQRGAYIKRRVLVRWVYSLTKALPLVTLEDVASR